MAGRVKTQLVIDGKNNTRAAFDQVNKSLDGMNKRLSQAGKSLVGAFSVAAIAGAVRGVANAADTYNLMNARLKLATESQAEFNTAQTELKRIAAATQSPLESLVTLYGRVSRPLKEAGRSQADILKITEAVAQSFRISGASAQEAENGVIQFAQALGAGALRGDEFNSVAEQAPRLMQALADGIGVPVGALKEMAAQGELTASVVTDALVGQLDLLREEAATLPETVGGAMTKLTDRWQQAIGQADVQPLIDAINSLADTISDPVIVSNLIALAGAIARIGSATVDAAAGVASFGKDLGYIAARVTGNVDEISRADKEIEKLKAAANGIGILDLYMSDEQIAQRLKEWEAYRDTLIEQQTGMTRELSAVAQRAQAEQESRQQQELSARRQYVTSIKTLQDELVEAAEKGAKALVAAEKKANSEIERIRAARVDIEQRYKAALAGLNSGGEASFGAANALKVGARQALQDGNIEEAQSKAQAALKMLQEMAAAGENTYGFAGFIKELQEIELAANDIERSAAEDKLTAIGVSMAVLKAEADKLKDMQVSFKADDASIEQVRAQIQLLAEQLGQTEIVLPVRASLPGSADFVGPLPEYATGGQVHGPGTGTSDSILARLSNGEYVMRAAAVAKFGPAFFDRLNGLQMPKFADGGLVGAAMSAPGPGRDLGRVDLVVGGEQFGLLADSDQFDRLLRRTASKFGGTR